MASESDPAKELRDYLAEWLRRHRSAESIAPYVQRQLNAAEWQEGSRAALYKAGAPQEITGNIDRMLMRNLVDVKSSLPLMPDYEQFRDEIVMGLTSSTTSAASNMVTALFAIAECPGASQAIDDAIKAYEALQQTQGRLAEARARLKDHFPALVELLDLADQKFELAKGNDDQIPDAAAAMRNLLDKLKGELFAKARRGPTENMTWSMMAERLGGPERSKHETLLDQEISRGQLYRDLSELLKRRTVLDVKRLSVAWMIVIDHIYVVCGCI